MHHLNTKLISTGGVILLLVFGGLSCDKNISDDQKKKTITPNVDSKSKPFFESGVSTLQDLIQKYGKPTRDHDESTIIRWERPKNLKSASSLSAHMKDGKIARIIIEFDRVDARSFISKVEDLMKKKPAVAGWMLRSNGAVDQASMMWAEDKWIGMGAVTETTRGVSAGMLALQFRTSEEPRDDVPVIDRFRKMLSPIQTPFFDERFHRGNITYTLSYPVVKTALADSQDSGKGPQRGSYLVINYLVENLGKTASIRSPDSLVFIDVEGQQLKPSIEATSVYALEHGIDLSISQLLPKTQRKQVAVFEVAPDMLKHAFKIKVGSGDKNRVTINAVFSDLVKMH